MKLYTKILSTLLISGCFLNQHASHAAPINAYVGASMGFQRGWGSLNGETFFDARALPPLGTATVPYSGRIGQSDPAGNLFFEVDTKVTNCFSVGLRPYYHLDSFEAAITKDGNLRAIFPVPPAGGFPETVEFSSRRRHAYGVLFVPKLHYFKEVTVYGLLGAEVSRFKAKISRTLTPPGADVTFTNFAKGVTSSAVVFGLGISRELGNWSLFAEGQYKHYQAKKFEENLARDGFLSKQFVKFSPKFASVMFGVKFKFI